MELAPLVCILVLCGISGLGFGVWAVNLVLNKHDDWKTKVRRQLEWKKKLDHEQPKNLVVTAKLNPVYRESYGTTSQPYNPYKEVLDVLEITDCNCMELFRLMYQVEKFGCHMEIALPDGLSGEVRSLGIFEMKPGKLSCEIGIENLHIYLPKDLEVPTYIWIGIVDEKNEKIAGEYIPISVAKEDTDPSSP